MTADEAAAARAAAYTTGMLRFLGREHDVAVVLTTLTSVVALVIAQYGITVDQFADSVRDSRDRLTVMRGQS